MENDTLYPIHFANGRLLQEVDRICKLKNIRYFMWAGTLLGAVRHGDFIPWDDDVDIIFDRIEYERFLAVAPDMLNDDFELVHPCENNTFFDMICKINYKESRLRIPTEEDDFYCGRHNRVSLDLFVLDDFCAGFKSKLMEMRLKMLYGNAMAYRYSIKQSEYSLAEKLSVMLLTGVGRLSTLNRIYDKYKKVSKACKKKSNKYIISNDRLPVLYRRYNKEWFDGVVRLRVGEYEYNAPSGYKEILEYIYGEYMKYPPIELQKPAHAERLSEVEVFDKGKLVR